MNLAIQILMVSLGLIAVTEAHPTGPIEPRATISVESARHVLSKVNKEEIEEVIELEETAIEEEVIVYEEEIIEEVTYEEVYEEPIVEEIPYEEEAPAPEPSSNLYLGSFESTAYAVGDSLTPNTYTRNGTDVSNTIYSPEGYRLIAVDTNVIPLNSLVEVRVPGWEPFLAIAADTGGAINGHKIDILMASISEALQFGRQYQIEIYLIN